MTPEKRYHFETVYRDSDGKLFAISDGWNLGDAPANFDFAAFLNHKWELVEAQHNPLGEWVTVYDRTGHIYAVERPGVWNADGTPEVVE